MRRYYNWCSLELNKVIETIQSHRSIRKYSGPPGKEDLEAIVNSAIRAPTAWNLMPVSIQVIEDPRLLEMIGDAVGGQEHVKSAPVLLSFSADYVKILKALDQLSIEKHCLSRSGSRLSLNCRTPQVERQRTPPETYLRLSPGETVRVTEEFLLQGFLDKKYLSCRAVTGRGFRQL